MAKSKKPAANRPTGAGSMRDKRIEDALTRGKEGGGSNRKKKTAKTTKKK